MRGTVVCAEAKLGGFIRYNKAKRTFDLWEPVNMSLPDYIRLSAQGKAKMVDGRVCLLKESGNVGAA